MVFDPQEKRRWTLGLEWRKYPDPEVGPTDKKYANWLEYTIDGDSLSERLIVKPGITPESKLGKFPERLFPALGCVGVAQEGTRFFSDTPGYWNPHRMLLEFEGYSTPQLVSCDFTSGRLPIYVCHCGYWECSSIRARIERLDKDIIVWHEFRHENCTEKTYSFEREWADIGPFFFDYEQYVKCLTELLPKPIDFDAS